MNESIVTRAEVAALIGVAADDARLGIIVSAANTWATSRRGILRSERVELVAGYGGNVVFLRESPIAAIAEVRIDYSGCGVFGDSTVVPDLTRFGFDPSSTNDDPRLLFAQGYFPESMRAAQIKYTAGFYPVSDSDTTHIPKVPDDLRLELIADIAERYTAGWSEKMKSSTIGKFSYTRFDDIDPKRKAIYRRYRIA